MSKLNVSPLTALVTGMVCLLGIFSEHIPFLDIGSLLLVFGGTLLSGVVAFNSQNILTAFNDAFQTRALHPLAMNERVALFSEFAQIARSKSIIALEIYAQREEEPLLRKGLQLVADGTTIEEIRYALKLDISILNEQRKKSIDIIYYLASIAPAAGLIGTVIGLIMMLSQIENSSELSSGMSLALLTTLYGAILSYLVLQPLGTKLEKNSKDLEMMETLTLEGILALASGVNPQLVQERLESFAA